MSKDTLIGVGVPFDRVRRVTGYLTKLARMNNGKQCEVAERVKHNMHDTSVHQVA